MTRDINQWVYDGEDGMSLNFANNNPRWTETTSKVFNEQLGCVPPVRQNSYGFMVGECYDYRNKQNQYACFMRVEINKKIRYFGRILPINPYSPMDFKTEILSQFKGR
jgi:hypothetical protein